MSVSVTSVFCYQKLTVRAVGRDNSVGIVIRINSKESGGSWFGIVIRINSKESGGSWFGSRQSK